MPAGWMALSQSHHQQCLNNEVMNMNVIIKHVSLSVVLAIFLMAVTGCSTQDGEGTLQVQQNEQGQDNDTVPGQDIGQSSGIDDVFGEDDSVNPPSLP